METFMNENTFVATERKQFGTQDNSKWIALLGVPGLSEFRSKKPDCFFQPYSSGAECSSERLIDEIETKVEEKHEVEYRTESKAELFGIWRLAEFWYNDQNSWNLNLIFLEKCYKIVWHFGGTIENWNWGEIWFVKSIWMNTNLAFLEISH